jgi:hypothetical protein
LGYCRERRDAGAGLFIFVLWTFFEASAAIISENATMIVRCSMERVSTIFLRLVISLFAIGVLALCIFKFPRMISEEAAKTPDTAWQIYLFLVGAYLQTRCTRRSIC